MCVCVCAWGLTDVPLQGRRVCVCVCIDIEVCIEFRTRAPKKKKQGHIRGLPVLGFFYVFFFFCLRVGGGSMNETLVATLCYADDHRIIK